MAQMSALENYVKRTGAKKEFLKFHVPRICNFENFSNPKKTLQWSKHTDPGPAVLTIFPRRIFSIICSTYHELQCPASCNNPGSVAIYSRESSRVTRAVIAMWGVISRFGCRWLPYWNCFVCFLLNSLAAIWPKIMETIWKMRKLITFSQLYRN